MTCFTLFQCSQEELNFLKLSHVFFFQSGLTLIQLIKIILMQGTNLKYDKTCLNSSKYMFSFCTVCFNVANIACCWFMILRNNISAPNFYELRASENFLISIVFSFSDSSTIFCIFQGIFLGHNNCFFYDLPFYFNSQSSQLEE